MTLVVDASVIVKWLLHDPANEGDTQRATELMRHVLEGQTPARQPNHWLVEVAAVLARTSPASIDLDIELLQALELPTADSSHVLSRACRLAVDLDQHLFDTLYHAVALETHDVTLVTADERYLAAGKAFGRITHLRDWRPTTPAQRP